MQLFKRFGDPLAITYEPLERWSHAGVRTLVAGIKMLGPNIKMTWKPLAIHYYPLVFLRLTDFQGIVIVHFSMKVT